MSRASRSRIGRFRSRGACPGSSLFVARISNSLAQRALTDEGFSTIMGMGTGSLLWEEGQCLPCGCFCWARWTSSTMASSCPSRPRSSPNLCSPTLLSIANGPNPGSTWPACSGGPARAQGPPFPHHRPVANPPQPPRSGGTPRRPPDGAIRPPGGPLARCR
jgi:hypothetical protein